jgi:hypothetical protein
MNGDGDPLVLAGDAGDEFEQLYLHFVEWQGRAHSQNYDSPNPRTSCRMR